MSILTLILAIIGIVAICYGITKIIAGVLIVGGILIVVGLVLLCFPTIRDRGIQL